MTTDRMTAGGLAAAAPSQHGNIGVLGAAALVAGSMVGAGVYLLPATLGAVGAISILGWLAAGVAALSLAGVFIWLAPLVPESEGLSSYVRAGLGPFFGVQSAVAYWVSCWAGLVPLALAGAGTVGVLIPSLASPEARLAVTIAIIWVGVGAAWAGPRVVARIEGLTLLIGLLPLLLAATVGWMAFRPEVFAASWNPHGLSVAAAVKASGLNCFYAFLGLECAAAAAAVVRDPGRNIPRATLLGVGATAVIYISASMAIMGLLPAADLAQSGSPYADLARLAMGASVGAAIGVCLVVRATGCLTAWMLVTAETSRGAADSGAFPAFFRTRPGERASAAGLLIPGVLMTVMAILSAQPNLGQQFSTLANAVSLLCLYVYVMAAVSLIRLARRRVAPILTAALAAAASVYLIAAGKPVELALSVLPFIAGGALYLWIRRR